MFGAGLFVSSLDQLSSRYALELSVQNHVGPIVNIADLSDAELYGIRDRARRRPFETPFDPGSDSAAVNGCPHCARKFVSALSLHQHVEDRRSACWKRRQA